VLFENTSVGDCVITYTVDPSSTAEFEIVITYGLTTVTSGVVTTSGSLTIAKNSNAINELSVEIIATDNVNVSVLVNCVEANEIGIVNVCLTSNADSGKFIHNEYRYTDAGFISPLQSTLVTFDSSPQSPVVSEYNIIIGPQGTGGFPPSGATMEIISNKQGFDTFDFNPAYNKFRYLRSNTLYPNTQVGIANLLAAATVVSPTGASGYYTGNFTVPSSGQYLYLIWDYRSSLPLELCYSNVDINNACCGCDVPIPAFNLCYSTIGVLDVCCGCND
jgi:hypothetical protein